MKYKSYENSAEEFATGLNAELLSAKDNVSARSVNRPIINILENQESNYNLIQTLLKTVYGNTNGIVPDVLENFAAETFEIGSFKNNSQNYFIRIPTGMMLLSKLAEEDYSNNNSNPFLKKGDYNYKDNIHKDCFLNDKFNSFLIENKPEINLYERELANLINLDLTDLTNDLRIYQDLVPMTVKVEIIDETGNPRLSSNGSPMYVTDENSKVVYLAKKGFGDLDIYYGDTKATINSLNYLTTYDKITNSETPNLNNETIKQTVTYRENLQTKIVPNGTYTNDINKALILKDASGNEKVRTGYYMNVVRATSGDDEVTWLPNKQQYAHWDIFLPNSDFGADSNTDVTVKFFDENEEVVETIVFYFSGSLTLQEINDKLFSEVLFFSKNFNIEKIQANDSTGNPIIGSRISVKNNNSYYDKYKLTISYKVSDETGSREFFYQDVITQQSINKLVINKSEEQQYFTNIFDLTNAFLGYFSSYFVNITNIYNYLNLEAIIKINNVAQTYYLYYDLDGKLENQTNDKYDKTGRFYLTTDGDPKVDSSNFIKLFEIKVEPNNILPNNPVVKSVKSFFDPLDRRLIATKRAELNSLLSTTRTELNNYIHIKDADDNREIEIKEKFSDANNEQLRITSPITRIVDVKDKEEHLTPATNNWTDSGEGDTPSDFFEESYEVLDTTKSEDDFNFKKYIYNNNAGKKGIIINKNKGISIFNYDESLVGGNTHSYSSFKPIEICSAKGNINLFNTNNSTGRINIANFKDASTNIVDIKGKTRIRSSNNDQLVIKKIGEIDKSGNNANVVFQIGQSKSKNDIDSLTSKTDTQNAVVGELSFTSGETGSSKDNIVSSNRKFTLGLTKAAGYLKSHIKTIFEARNTKDNSDNEKTVITSYSSIVPENDKVMLGYPINSRTYKLESNYIPYVTNEDVDSNILASIKKEGSNYTGTSTEYINNENRWAAAFINRGYFGRIILADTADDVKNKDARNGALRLGNSNIFDVSSLFINKTRRTINFDNEISNTSENTIYSNYSGDVSRDGLFFLLNRKLELSIDTDLNKEPSNAENYCAFGLKTNGAHINKNAYIYRQTFININSGESESTTENNSSLVVKGQTVLNGELVIGKNAKTIDDTANHTSSTSIIRNSSDKYKKYNEEYFEKDAENHLLDKSGDEYLNLNKENWLYEFVNYGHSYFEKDITVKGKFTEDTILNRTLKILNHNYANYDYNEKTPNCPEGNARKVKNTIVDSYDNSSTKLPRNNVSLDVESGLIKFGSNSETLEMDDQSDLELFGSQWIKRRLEINSEGSSLRNTSMSFDNIKNKNNYESPAFYVNGASQFSGNAVFGNSLVTYTDRETGKIYKVLANNKAGSANNPAKVIFWGANEESTKIGEETNWHSDFDFHGKTWFDYRVRIGRDTTDHLASNSYDNAGQHNGSLEILGKNAEAALKISGKVHFEDGQQSYWQAQQLTFEADSDPTQETGNISRLVLNSGRDYKNAELYSTNNINITSDSEINVEGNSGVNVGSSGNIKLNSSAETSVVSKSNIGITSEGNIELLTKTSDTSIILKNTNNGSIILGNNTKKTDIDLLTDNGTISAKYKSSGSFKVTLAGTNNDDKITANSNSITLQTNSKASIILSNDASNGYISSNANSITSVANTLTHLCGDAEKISVNSTSSIFKYDGSNSLSLSNGNATLTGGGNNITLDSSKIAINVGSEIVNFNSSGTVFTNSNIAADNLNLTGNGTLSIYQKTGASLSLGSTAANLGISDTSINLTKTDATITSPTIYLKFNSSNEALRIWRNASNIAEIYVNHQLQCASNLRVASGYLYIGDYAISIS